ncbi:protein bassoon isoform X2 [Stegostoma tigrinum]|nr:protein bassoon isoform X2 [Stegostoma tigrinum]XP_048403414.2 protein bassoon isoform X2 [Stegostoma tigrinum]XP_048403415.2 protein bassoon isoform X2 [Stegostoma tigrinum]
MQNQGCSTQQNPQQEQRRNLQADTSTKRGERSHSASPDKGSAPTSPYSVPQIAPLPSSTLCPICATTELNSYPKQPNFNTCTQCRSVVCKQCGFNPNPHITEVEEWLCLNCQMQRALGMDMTTAPRSKSQQQLHSPSHQAQTEPQTKPQRQPQTDPVPQQGRTTPIKREIPKVPSAAEHKPETRMQPSEREKQGPITNKSELQPAAQPQMVAQSEAIRPVGKSQQTKPAPAEQRQITDGSPARTQAGPSNIPQDQEGITGKLFGFGTSLLSQATSLISTQPEQISQSQQSPAKGSAAKQAPKIIFSDQNTELSSKLQSSTAGLQVKTEAVTAAKQEKLEPVIKQKEVNKPKVLCPLCKTELNVGSSQPPNFNNCTECKVQVCNMCGFNPTPHLVEKNEWLCLNCQTQRLMSGNLGDAPLPVPSPVSKQQPSMSPHHQTGQTVVSVQQRKGASQQQAGPVQLQKVPVTSGQQLSQRRETPTAKLGQPMQTKQQGPMVVDKQHAQQMHPGHSEAQTTIPNKSQSPREKPKPAIQSTTVPASSKVISTDKKVDPSTKETSQVPELQKAKLQEELSKGYPQEQSRSPQSLSDTGYSSDGISSSQSEITTSLHHEAQKLNESGPMQQSPKSPSEFNKLESSVRPLLESQSVQDKAKRGRTAQSSSEEQRQGYRPRSLSITPESCSSDEELEDIQEEDEDTFELESQGERRESLESLDEFGRKLQHGYVEDRSGSTVSAPHAKNTQSGAEITDEEFMRRQLLEMSADEDDVSMENEDLDSHAKRVSIKKSQKRNSESNKQSPSKQHQDPSIVSNYEDTTVEGYGREDIQSWQEQKEHEDTYRESLNRADEDAVGEPAGLRRFKTIDLNTTNTYISRDVEGCSEADLTIDREPELEMESLTGSPDEKSKGEYSSTLPPSTPTFSSGTSPTSVSSLEEDSDSSPSRRHRLEEVKQQRKARHRSHGPLLPTIEDSSEEEELREEEELLREQEKMREVEQHRIRSTARKAKRDKEELRAQRRRERSKTPPSNLSPIEDASPTEELRQAAEMEELHRSSCSEYSPTMDSEAEGFEITTCRLYKSGSEYNLPSFMSLYSPTEKSTTSSSSVNQKPLKSAEEAYEEMMRKAEMLKTQQPAQTMAYGSSYQQDDYMQNNYKYQPSEVYTYSNNEIALCQTSVRGELQKAEAYETTVKTAAQTPKLSCSPSLELRLQQQNAQLQNLERSFQEKKLLDAQSAYTELAKQTDALLTPGTSPTQSSAPMTFVSSQANRGIPDVRVTQYFMRDMQDQTATPIGTKVDTSHIVTASYTTYNKKSAVTVATAIVSQSSMSARSSPIDRSMGYIQVRPSDPGISTPYCSQNNLPGGKKFSESYGAPNLDGATTQTPGSFFKTSSPEESLSPSSLTAVTRTDTSTTSLSSGKSTTEFSTQTCNARVILPSNVTVTSSPSTMMAQGTQTSVRSPRLTRQVSSPDSTCMVITLASNVSSSAQPLAANSSVSPNASPTRLNRQQTLHGWTQQVPASTPQQMQLQSMYAKSSSQIDRTSMMQPTQRGQISSTVVTTSTVLGQVVPVENTCFNKASWFYQNANVNSVEVSRTGSSVVDLRTAAKSPPVIITDHGMDLTSLATESRKYSLESDQIPCRQSTAVQPLIMNLNVQEHPHVNTTSNTTLGITITSSMLISQSKAPKIYGDPFQNLTDLGHGTATAICLTQARQLESMVQPLTVTESGTNTDMATVTTKSGFSSQIQPQFARFNLANQMTPVRKLDMSVNQGNINNAISVSAIPRSGPLDSGFVTSQVHQEASLELKPSAPPANMLGAKAHTMMVQLDSTAAGTVTKLLKQDTPSNALDLTGAKPEKAVCCDVVYKFPFASSCTGSFNSGTQVPEQAMSEPQLDDRNIAQKYYDNRAQESLDSYQYKEPMATYQDGSNLYKEHKTFPQVFSGRLHSSMSDSNLLEATLNYNLMKDEPFYHPPGGDAAVDLSTMRQSYSLSFGQGRDWELGMQYGSFTDLRQQSDILSQPTPIRRYSSMSNIHSGYGYSIREDLPNFQEASLAQYSATTAREISRMCAALNSMDHYGTRYTNSSDSLQYGPAGPNAHCSELARNSVMSHHQTMLPLKQDMKYRPSLSDSRRRIAVHGFGNMPQAVRLRAIRHMYPSAAPVRAPDGMIYSTINTPIASTLPITTQPASILCPVLRGVYRPYLPGNITAVPLARLSRLPLVAPRMPAAAPGLYHYLPANRFPAAPITAAGETPIYLGKSGAAPGNNVRTGGVNMNQLVPGQTTQRQEQSGIPQQNISAAVTQKFISDANQADIGLIQQQQQLQHQAQSQQQRVQVQQQQQLQPQVQQQQVQQQIQPQQVQMQQQKQIQLQEVQMQQQMQQQQQIQPQQVQMQQQQQIQPQQVQMQQQQQIQPQQVQMQQQQQIQPQQLQMQQQMQQPQQVQIQQVQQQLQAEQQLEQQKQQQLQKQLQQMLQQQLQQQEAQQSDAARTGAGRRKHEDKEEEHQRKQQQDHMLLIERERVELEKLRHQRLQEELERQRLELQRHRESEQIIVQRELQELQTIKQQVLHQQQEERQAQLVLQREQLAQQRLQLEQIQQLQQQLHQQLEEQKVRNTVSFPAVCDPSGRINPHSMSDMAIEMQRTIAQNGQYWPVNQPYIEGVPVATTAQEAYVSPHHRAFIEAPQRSTSELSLRTDEHWENRTIKKRNSVPRLRDAYEGDDASLRDQYVVKKIADCSVQTDDEEGEEGYYMSRRRRSKRSVDCSVQTDDEDNGELEQPTRRRRSRFSKHSDSSTEHKREASKGTSSIAIQTVNDCSVQTDQNELGPVSPAIHITPDPRVEIVRYISAPEKTHKGESLACQTEPEAQSQSIVVPQFAIPTTINPYSTNIRIVTSGPLDQTNNRQQGVMIVPKAEKKKPDPLEIGYQCHLPPEPLPQMTRQPPKSPQVLYSPVSPLSPHRLLDSTFTSCEKLNKAHITPQKHFTTESPKRQQSLPRPIKVMQRSMSDPKPVSPTSDESGKSRFFAHQQQQALHGSQIGNWQQSTTKKVKRTLPSPPPEEIIHSSTQLHPQLFGTSLPRKRGTLPDQVTRDRLLKDISHELEKVEQESNKLQKKQAELDEEEKEIDAKLRYIELGINRRKETFVKEPTKRDVGYVRGLGEDRDYMSDSEVNNIRIPSYNSKNVLARPQTAPVNQYSEYSMSQHPTTSSQYPPSQATPQGLTNYQTAGYQPSQYPVPNTYQSQSNLQSHSTLHSQNTFQPHAYPQNTNYQTDGSLQNVTGLQPSNQYQAPATYTNQASFQSGHNAQYQQQTNILSQHQKPRQTSLADLEQKIPTNYEVIVNPDAIISATATDKIYTTTTMSNSYDQYKNVDVRVTDSGNAIESPSTNYSADSLYTNLEHNVSRNYVMIDDISELTKENTSATESQKVDQPAQHSSSRHAKEKNDFQESTSSTRTHAYNKVDDESEEDMYDVQISDHRGKNGYQRNSDSHSRISNSSSGYYYADNNHRHSSRTDKHNSSYGPQKHSSKQMAPAVVSSKRSKHRKQNIEQKISKFSPIEEAKDVESDFASYTVTTTAAGNNVILRAQKLQDEITYGLKKNIYDQQRYSGHISREAMEDSERGYSNSNRSRSSSMYGMEKAGKEAASPRSKSYERDTMERSQKIGTSHSRGRAPIKPNASEEEGPLSPMGNQMHVARTSRESLPPNTVDSRSQFGSSHSLPDVQDVKESSRSHAYREDDGYVMDDMHCAVSDSEAYHLGQEETDWFEKPKERSRRYGGQPSAQRRSHRNHLRHNYEEAPADESWQQAERSQSRYSSKDHQKQPAYQYREPARHSSRHAADEPSRKPSRQHPKEQHRQESRQYAQQPSQRRGQSAEQRSQRDPHLASAEWTQPRASGHHPEAEPSRSQKHSQQQQQAARRQSESPQQQGRVQHSQPASSRSHSQQQARPAPSQQRAAPAQQQQPRQAQPQQQQHPGPAQQQQQVLLRQPQQQQQALQQPQQQQAQQPQQQQQQAQQQQQQPRQQSLQQSAGQPQPQTQPQPQAQQAQTRPATTTTKPGQTTTGKPAVKQATAPQQAAHVAGSKPGEEKEGDIGAFVSKMLPGGAAEQAGKLTEGIASFGRKLTSFW